MDNTSYKDPSGFIFKHENEIYRQINLCAKEDYDFFRKSGLYDELVSKELLVSHDEVGLDFKKELLGYKVIKPRQISYITYPYEWSFSALKDAALLTLEIQEIALKYKMSLKDASAYNVQFINSKPIFIDTLSFSLYNENTPWQAYGQFCKHFLAPLALMSYVDINLNKLLITYIDGIPLSLVKNLLPLKAKMNIGIFIHVFMHSISQVKFEGKMQARSKNTHMSLNSQLALLESLKDTINSLHFPDIKTEWGEYYKNTNYSNSAFDDKKNIIDRFLDKIKPSSLCDLGANRGDFARLAQKKGIETFAFDVDPLAVEDNYLYIKNHGELNISALLQDFTNLSPAIGFMNDERSDFISRFKVDAIMSLALIHHLAISNNLPFINIAKFYSHLANYLIVEFIPKNDSKVKILLSSREDIFDNYNKEAFEKDFSVYFDILEAEKIRESERILYLMRKK